MNFEDWIRTQVEYGHLLRKYGDTIFIKHNGEYQRFDVRLASKAFDKDKAEESNNVDWIEDYANT